MPAVLPAAMPVPGLTGALALIDRHFGIDAMLADEGQDRVAPYYAQSRRAYDRLHSAAGCMHVALNPDGRFRPAGFLVQPKIIARHVAVSGAATVLELGSGLGFNARFLARTCPQVRITGLDRLPEHVAEAGRRAEAEALPNLTFRVGDFNDLPADLGRFDLICAVETLCYARDPRQLAQAIARHLNPGGRLVLFEPLARSPEARLSGELAVATRLYRLGVAIGRPLPTAADWMRALAAAGLRVIAEDDLTAAAAPGLMLLHRRAAAHLQRPLARAAVAALPRYLARNAATALTGPFVCFGPGPVPDPEQGSVAYRRIVARAAG